MKSRREFVKNSALAATALIAANPIQALAAAASPFQGIFSSDNKFLLLYTANLQKGDSSNALEFIQRSAKDANVLLLNAGHASDGQNSALDHDLVFFTAEERPVPEYRVIHKGGIRTGIIHIAAGEQGAVQKVNRLAAYLKKDKDCRIVVCLSELGYQQKKGTDDLTLAARSTDLDIIIGVHAHNPKRRPTVAFNSQKSEVFIHPVVAGEFAVGKIEIGFDRQGRKRHVSLMNELPRNKNRAIAAS